MISKLTFGDKNYPAALKEIPNPPLGLFYRGELTNSKNPHVAIVGTRKATLHGKRIAKKISQDLATAGCVIVSGLAMGIDTAAHEGALEAKGRTVAVLANGLDWIYPRQNEKLAEKILSEKGTIFSEYPVGDSARKENFLARNRIVSGLSLGIVVIEAPEGSGALSTASHALEQNREVFIVPGPLNNENYIGSHKLIRAGARLVTSAADILDDLNLESLTVKQRLPIDSLIDQKQKEIVIALKSAGEPLSIDKISELIKIDVSTINRNLTFLLIKGIVKEESGHYYL